MISQYQVLITVTGVIIPINPAAGIPEKWRGEGLNPAVQKPPTETMIEQAIGDALKRLGIEGTVVSERLDT